MRLNVFFAVAGWLMGAVNFYCFFAGERRAASLIIGTLCLLIGAIDTVRVVRHVLRAASVALLLLSPLATFAAEPAPSVKTPFKFPAARTPSAPPATTPGDVLRLAGDTLYVIPHDEPFLLFDSHPTLATSPVTITRETGPIKIRGRFLDGSGAVETRTFTAKHLAIVEPVAGATGRAELIAVPTGATDEKAAARQLIDVNHGAQPPPDEKKETIPGPKPVPPDVTPEPKPKPVVTGPLWLVLVEELDDRTPATAKLVNDVAFWQRMKARQVYFRPYDQNEPAAVSKGYVEAATKANVGLPALILLDKDGDVIWVKPRPKDTAAVEALVKEVSP